MWPFKSEETFTNKVTKEITDQAAKKAATTRKRKGGKR